MLLMDGESKDGIVVAKNVSSTIAMMNVSIHADRLLNECVGLKSANCDCNVVNRAETFAVIGVGVVKAAGKITCEAVAQCELSGKNGASGGEPDGFGEFGRVRNLQFHDFAGGERAVF